MAIIDQIRALIAEGETEKSLHELYSYVKENNAAIIDNLVLLKSRMRNLLNDELDGTLDDKYEALERASINKAILKLLPQLTPEYIAQASQKEAEEGIVEKEARFLEKSLSPTQGTLLYNVLATHAGYAIWKSVYNDVNGQSIFRIENDKECQGIKNHQVVTTFQIVTNSANYVTLYDAERQLFLRIGDTIAQFNNEGEDIWCDLYDGGWTTPPDAQWTTSK